MDHLPFAAFEDPFLFTDVDEGLYFFLAELRAIRLFFLFLAIQSLEDAPQREEQRPEEVIEEMRERNEMSQNHLPDVVGNHGQDEFPDHDDDDPDERRSSGGPNQRPAGKQHHGGSEGQNERNLQKGPAHELQVPRVVDEPAAAPLELGIRAPAAEGHRADLLGKVTRGVEDEVEKAANNYDREPLSLREATSHRAWREILSTEEKRHYRSRK